MELFQGTNQEEQNAALVTAAGRCRPCQETVDGTEEPSKDRPYGFLCRFGTREDPILAKITQNQYTEGYLLQLFTYKQDGKYAERQLALHTTFPAANHEAAVRAGQKLIRNTVKRYFKRVQAFSNTIPVNDEILYLGRK